MNGFFGSNPLFNCKTNKLFGPKVGVLNKNFLQQSCNLNKNTRFQNNLLIYTGKQLYDGYKE